MDKRIFKQVILIIILFLIFAWIKKDDLITYIGLRPSAETLDFNQEPEDLNNRSVILSSDEEINIEDNPEAAQKVQEINNGSRSVPTIVFPDGKILVEPSNEELGKALELGK